MSRHPNRHLADEFSQNSSRSDKTADVVPAVANPETIRDMSVLGRGRALVFAFAAIAAQAAAVDEVTVQQAVDKIQRETNAKVLSVQTLQVGKRKLYRIKLLTPGGEVRVVDVKANP